MRGWHQEQQAITDIKLDRVFIGSCTNSRIEDLRSAAAVIKGRKVASSIKQAMVVAGSGLVKKQAEAEGLDKVFLAAGFEWREPGCSMCLAMNADKLLSGEHCASTSNHNFEGRQGVTAPKGGTQDTSRLRGLAWGHDSASIAYRCRVSGLTQRHKAAKGHGARPLTPLELVKLVTPLR